MFERNKVDNAIQQSTVPAEITLTSGEVVKGRFVITSSRSITDVLNGESQFLEFETFDGERALLAKSTLAAVRLIAIANATSLKSRMRDAEIFDPHAVLGLSGDAAWDDVRQAYLTLSKTYHPDRFAGVALPTEVRDYLAAMARRINAAYTALEVPHQAAKRADGEKARPIFTSAAMRQSASRVADTAGHGVDAVRR